MLREETLNSVLDSAPNLSMAEKRGKVLLRRILVVVAIALVLGLLWFVKLPILQM